MIVVAVLVVFALIWWAVTYVNETPLDLKDGADQA